jgi:hypothetical protein
LPQAKQVIASVEFPEREFHRQSGGADAKQHEGIEISLCLSRRNSQVDTAQSLSNSHISESLNGYY